MAKTAIIITTFERDELLSKSIKSLDNLLSEDLQVIIVDQNALREIKFLGNYLSHIWIPFNSGLSYARNEGVKKAKELGCEYCVIGSDSFLFNESLKYINVLTDLDLNGYDLLGFELGGCVCDWEANIILNPGNSFNLTFIDKNDQPKQMVHLAKDITLKIWKCNIVRNFFIARTESLIHSPWNKDLKLCEHEDFFWRYATNNYNVGWTNFISAYKMNSRPQGYSELRETNFREGKELLKKLYGIKGWVTYANEPTGRRK